MRHSTTNTVHSRAVQLHEPDATDSGTWLDPYETGSAQPGLRRHGRSVSSPALTRVSDDPAGASIETKGAGRSADLLVTTRQLSRSRYCFTKSQPTSAM